MKHFPIYLAVEGRDIVVSGGGEAALAKLRLLLKTEGKVTVFAVDIAPEVEMLAAEGKLAIVRQSLQAGDAKGSALFYAANDWRTMARKQVSDQSYYVRVQISRTRYPVKSISLK